MGKWTQTHMEVASLWASLNPSPSKCCIHLRWNTGMIGRCITVYKNEATIISFSFSHSFLSFAVGMDGTSLSFPITLDPFCVILVLCLVSSLLLSVAGSTPLSTSYKVPLLNKSSPLSLSLFLLFRGDYSLAEHRHGLFYLMLVTRPKPPSIHWLLTHWCWLHLVSFYFLFFLFYFFSDTVATLTLK